ncbi:MULTISPECIES: hypothetical protein [Staphylococcus]|uniref:hypothetical protein n=1 Tax=Staphylococcus TaxID=1279 RepID=UPI00037EDB59|nr:MULTISPECIES: hypothetical protein [Staphylococcus]MBL3398904.1 hypothetical protein [Staphylococcus pasteuri]MBM6506076.1 hypothetical protein [Staphylococcus pasteuri]MEB7434623.1 hypothetical protein [Staphylococcus pasteuri]PTU82034.1 hypothetical protein BUZ66_07810 [Staphylococcus pasteuri]PTU83279.1 hypothetical protein BUZ62_12320 [Staphylococcus pasteuri]
MRREELKPFRNKSVVVTGRLEYIGYKNKLDRDLPYKRNVRILLKDVQINGISIDHLWLFERQKYFKIGFSLLYKRVKFRAIVVPYLKLGERFYIEDYGIQRKSSLMTEEEYNENKPFKR